MTRYAVLFLALPALTGCESRRPAAERPIVSKPAPGPKPTPTPEPGRPVVAKPAPEPKPRVPDDPRYRIGSDADDGPTRRQVEVNLREKVTPETLRQIALEVKAREEHPHERTAIFYYLPVIFPEVGAEVWATTHFRPDLEVKIMGLSRAEEDALRAIPLEHKGRRIGAWLQDNQYKTIDLIYEENGAIKLAEIRSPTDRTETPLVELASTKGRRFRKAKGTNLYDVDYRGDLRMSNAQGQVLSAARPLK